MAHSLLHVPVPAVEELVLSLLSIQAPEFVRTDQGEFHAHITLLGPFAPLEVIDSGLVRRLAGIFRACEPFEFQLVELMRFASGIAYLAPRPNGPFRRLTDALVSAFPDYPPYGGQVADVIPHLTVGRADTSAAFQSLRSIIAPKLPIATTASAAHLVWWDGPATWTTLATFAFESGGRS